MTKIGVWFFLIKVKIFPKIDRGTLFKVEGLFLEIDPHFSTITRHFKILVTFFLIKRNFFIISGTFYFLLFWHLLNFSTKPPYKNLQKDQSHFLRSLKVSLILIFFIFFDRAFYPLKNIKLSVIDNTFVELFYQKSKLI